MQTYITSWLDSHRQLLPQMTVFAWSKGSIHETSAAMRKLQGVGMARSLNWIALMSLLTHLTVQKGLILESRQFEEKKDSRHNKTTIFFSACALSATNLIKACSFLFPWNPWITNFFTCWRHPTGQASCQNLRLTFPVGLSTFTDCK